MRETATAAQVGSAFEGRVAAYYEALGFKIDRNVQLGQHQIDLLVTKYIAGASVLSYIVEAKFRTKGSVGIQEMTDFINVARDLIAEGEVSGGVMITNTSFSKNAGGKVLGSKTVKFLTISQLETELFATSDSLLRTCADYERKKIRDEYIPLSGIRRPDPATTIPDVVAFLKGWLAKNGGLVTLSGDFGSGKTTVMDRLFYELAQARIETSRGRYPIQLRLRSLLSHGTVWSFVSNSLRDNQYINPDKSTFESLLAAGGLIFLLDGFDEIHTGATSVERAHYLKRLLPILSSPCPCILSTRPTYFLHFKEMNSVFQRLLEPKAKFDRLESAPIDLEWLLGRLNISSPETLPEKNLASAIQLNALSEEDILAYLTKFKDGIKKATGGDERTLLGFLHKIYDISDLLRRPLLLNMIVVTIVEGKLDITRTKSTIGPSTLYDLYTQMCAKRDASKRGGFRNLAPVLTPAERLAGCRALAMAMLHKGAIELRASEIQEVVAGIRVSRKPVIENMALSELRERVLTDIRLCSFLSFSDDDTLRFGHKSFFEFFVAQQFLLDVSSRLETITGFARFKVTKEMVGFLGSYARDLPEFARHVTSAFHNRGGDGAEIDAMFYRIAIASGTLLETIPLRGKKVFDVELRRAAVNNASFDSVILSRVEFDGIKATDWKLRKVTFIDSVLEETQFRDSKLHLRLERATMRSLRFDNCDVALIGSEADLEDLHFSSGRIVLDLEGDARGLHVKSPKALTLGQSLLFKINAQITVEDTVVNQPLASRWYQSGSSIRFSDCALLGVFINGNDIGGVLGREGGHVKLERCKGVILTRDTKKALGGAPYLVRSQEAGDLLIVDAGELERALEERPDPSGKSPPIDLERSPELRLARQRRAALLEAIQKTDLRPGHRDLLPPLLADALGLRPQDRKNSASVKKGAR